MKRLIPLLWLCSLACFGQAGFTGRSTVATTLDFEKQESPGAPFGWGGTRGTIFADDKIVHSGHWSARIEREPTSASAFSTMTQAMVVDFSGKSIEFRGWLRTEDVTGFSGLWMREDGESGSVAFDNMQRRLLKGTTPWTEYSITLQLKPEAKQLFFGVLQDGTGKTWADDLQILVDGQPIASAPRLDLPKTALDTDRQFDGGSGIALASLSKVQIENLVTLGKVWGFLKYYHPLVVSGQKHWDYELFRVLPALLAAPNRTDANTAIDKWIASLGAVAACSPCAKLDETNLHFGPDVKWIEDEARLGHNLSGLLRSVYANRPASGKQFYVSFVPSVGNPSFEHEPTYPTIKLPDTGFQLLGLYRFWNMVQYWFPYRDIIGEDWDAVLAESVPLVALAKDSDSYQRELMRVIARAHDGHANLWSSLKLRPLAGDCQIPVGLRVIEGKPLVNRVDDAVNTGLMRGDVIEEVDGVPIDKIFADAKPFYGSSNDGARLHNMALSLARGTCAEATLRVRRGTEAITVHAKRVAPSQKLFALNTHDLPGPAFRLLSKEIGYLKLSSFLGTLVPDYLKQAAGTKGLIIDIRNYPSDFAVFALGQALVEKSTRFAVFTQGDLTTPGAFRFGPAVSLEPGTPHYSGKIAILVDESSMSQAEYTAMAFRSVPGAIVVGSSTSGADGNVSPIVFPGGFRAMFSGIGVFYPDRKPTQRVGIVPDVRVVPTIEGFRAGRDEVLEEAVRQIVGGAVPADILAGIARSGAKDGALQ